jgi:hypothetical protein
VGVRAPSDSPPSARAPWQVGGLILAGALAGAATFAASANPTPWLAGLLVLVVPSPIYVRVLQRRFDPFEPIQIIAVAFCVLFVARPLAELAFGIEEVAGLHIRPGFDGAASICLVGTLSLYAGYASGLGSAVARRLPGLRGSWNTRRSVSFSIGLLLVAALLTAAFAATIGPGTLLRFYLGRTTTDYQAFLATTGYVALGPYLTIPVSFILLLAFMKRRTFGVGVLLLLTLAAALYVIVPRGDRTYILALFLPLIVLWFLRRDRRPSGVTILVALFVGILMLNVLLAVRRVELRPQLGVVNTVVDAVTSPGRQVKDFLTGIDLAEFSVLELEYLAINRETDGLALHPGATLKSLATGPFPRKLVGDKPKSGLEYVTDYVFPVNERRASFGPSMFGDLFADSGWVSLIGFAFLIGVAVRVLWDYLLRHPDNEGMQLFFAALLPLLIIMARDSFTFAVARAVFLAFPLLVCLLVCSRPPRRRFIPHGGASLSSGATPARSASR